MPLCRAFTLATTIFALGVWVGITQAGELKDNSQQKAQNHQAKHQPPLQPMQKRKDF